MRKTVNMIALEVCIFLVEDAIPSPLGTKDCLVVKCPAAVMASSLTTIFLLYKTILSIVNPNCLWFWCCLVR